MSLSRAGHVQQNEETELRQVRTRIKEFRVRQNLTQERLAEIAGVRRETIVFLEQGKYNPSLRLAYNVARALNASIDELFVFDDEAGDR